MRQIIIALIPGRQKIGHSEIRLTVKIIGNKGSLHPFGITEAAVAFQTHIFIVCRNDFRNVIGMRIKKLAHTELA